MKRAIISISLLLITKVGISQTKVLEKTSVNNHISLAGEELSKYQKKQSTSIILTLIGTGIAALGSTQEDVKPIMVVSGLVFTSGVVINISSLTNLRKSANHLKNYKK